MEVPKTSYNLDQEFDRGSQISFTELSKTQIDNLATFGKIWGFLNYHHPGLTAAARLLDGGPTAVLR